MIRIRSSSSSSHAGGALLDRCRNALPRCFDDNEDDDDSRWLSRTWGWIYRKGSKPTTTMLLVVVLATMIVGDLVVPARQIRSCGLGHGGGGGTTIPRNATTSTDTPPSHATTTTTTTTANHHHHTTTIYTLDDFYAEQEYSWIGNQWYPAAEGVPVYTPSLAAGVWQNLSVLWFGDSTCRQDWATQFALIDPLRVKPVVATNQHANNTTTNTTNTTIPIEKHNLPVGQIDRFINTNKKAFVDKCELRPIADPTNLYSELSSPKDPKLWMCRNTRPPTFTTTTTTSTVVANHTTTTAGSTNTTTTTTNTTNTPINATTRSVPSPPLRHGKFDYRRCDCPKDSRILGDLEPERDDDSDHYNFTNTLSDEYDLVIVQYGVWLFVRAQDCRAGKSTTATDEELLAEGLEEMHRLSQHNVTVFWKTLANPSRPHEAKKGRGHSRTEKINQFARDWFANTKPSNMYLIDWGRQMDPRSVGPDTIVGDMYPHWGLPARLLAAQMVTHAARRVFSGDDDGIVAGG